MSDHHLPAGRLLRAYCKDRRLLLVTALCMYGAMAVVIGLYGLALEAVGYGALLSLVPAAIAIAIDAWRYCARHRKLAQLGRTISLSLDGLPTAHSLEAEQYQALIKTLYDLQSRQTAQAMARQTDMTDYYTLWAHQIKVPLSAMDLLLQAGKLDTQLLQSQRFRVEQYVDMALNYIRLESTSSDYVFGVYQLDEIVRGVIRKYAGLFVLKGLTLDYEPAEQAVLTDEKWLSFALEQLVSNALKYTRTGGITIALREGQLMIADTGVGIAREDLPRVFEKGFTGYNGRGNTRSSGLGLYLCKTALERLSHTVAMTSVPGEGTAVYIGFPKKEFEGG